MLCPLKVINIIISLAGVSENNNNIEARKQQICQQKSKYQNKSKLCNADKVTSIEIVRFILERTY